MEKKLTDLFAEQQENVLYTALQKCAEDYAEEFKKEVHEHIVYDFLEDTARASLTVLIVKKVNELGYKIEKQMIYKPINLNNK